MTIVSPWIWNDPRWPTFSWDEAALTDALTRAHGAVGGVSALFDALSAPEQREMELEAAADEGVATAAIEGQTINRDSLRASLRQRLERDTSGWPRPAREDEGLAAVLHNAVAAWNRGVTVQDLCAWQESLFPGGLSGYERIVTGAVRPGPIQIVTGGRIGGAAIVHYEGPPAHQVAAELDRLVAWLDNTPNLNGLVRAAVAHVWFELIHPFEDGNGRVGRALVEHELARAAGHGVRLFSLSKRLAANKHAYYEELDRYNRAPQGGASTIDVTKWVVFFVDQVAAAAWDARRSLDGVCRRARFWGRTDVATDRINARQAKVINAWLGYGPEMFNTGITNSRFASIAQTSRATATRDLTDLVLLGVLATNNRGGRSRGYVFADAGVWHVPHLGPTEPTKSFSLPEQDTPPSTKSTKGRRSGV